MKLLEKAFDESMKTFFFLIFQEVRYVLGLIRCKTIAQQFIIL